MGKETKITYNDNDRAIVNALKDTDGLTLAEINEKTGLELKSGNIVAAMRKGLIASIGEKEIFRETTRKVSTYAYVNSDTGVNAKGEPLNFTEGQAAILKAASGIEGYFTLAQLAEVMGVEKVASGSVVGLIKRGNLVKGDQVEVPAMAKATNKIYGFVKDIPADAE